MAGEIAIVSNIATNMQQAASLAGSSAVQLATINLREQWESEAGMVAQSVLQRRQQDMGALAQAAVNAGRLARETTGALLALQQAGKL
ncbi:hypothetical protein [Varibaculum sp.]|uniref:hypothetical protein n=1 Tax=Varibaculum sp. TaxID=1895474 RepID=UPI0025F33408|nr:hypothetical protein [Varibaculum sp.]